MTRWPFGISISAGRLRQAKPRDYLVRFAFGGLVTVAAGLIATRFGPVLGGLFLAFPAILPASLTLVAQHAHNSQAAGAEAYGSLFGSLGLLVFAALVWMLGMKAPGWLVLATALLAWIVTSCGCWATGEQVRAGRAR